MGEGETTVFQVVSFRRERVEQRIKNRHFSYLNISEEVSCVSNYG